VVLGSADLRELTKRRKEEKEKGMPGTHTLAIPIHPQQWGQGILFLKASRCF
jgi:hypothetical protein